MHPTLQRWTFVVCDIQLQRNYASIVNKCMFVPIWIISAFKRWHPLNLKTALPNMSTILICILAILATSTRGYYPAIFFCCEKGRKSGRPFCGLYKNSYLDWHDKCEPTTIWNKVTGGPWEDLFEHIDPISPKLGYADIRQEFFGCANNVDAPSVKVIRDDALIAEVSWSNSHLFDEFPNDSLQVRLWFWGSGLDLWDSFALRLELFALCCTAFVQDSGWLIALKHLSETDRVAAWPKPESTLTNSCYQFDSSIFNF